MVSRFNGGREIERELRGEEIDTRHREELI
jgi:hypothetical protein